MRIHITRTNNIGGAAFESHNMVAKLGHELGFIEMGIYHYPAHIDDDNELNHRMDGIISGISAGDIVIVQYPTWNELRFDHSLVEHIKWYGAKVIIFVNDFQSLMWTQVSEETYINSEIALLNKADVLILPSAAMHKDMISFGLSGSIPVIYQRIWDYKTEMDLENHKLERKMIFTGRVERFPFLNDYDYETAIDLYGGEKLEHHNRCICEKGLKEQKELIFEIAKGGFGLVWSDEEYFERYYSKNQPYKLGVFLTAGIPVIIRKGAVHEDFIKRNGLGFVVESLGEASDIVQNISEDEYKNICEQIRPIQNLIKEGFYTKKVLIDAVVQLVEGI